MSGVRLIEVASDEAELRLDRWFRRHFPDLSHIRLEKLLRTGQVRVDGGRVTAGHRLAGGMMIRVPPLGEAPPPPARAASAPPRQQDVEALLERILYRDKDVLAIDKPAGLAVQGGTNMSKHLDGMLDALRFDAKERPRLVHRIDLAVAKSGEDEEDARPAATYYTVVEQAAQKAAWLALLPVTGRTHQLRIHCAGIATPIIGDGKYGGATSQLPGLEHNRKLHLHARSIALDTPNGGRIAVVAPLPPHMLASWKFFGFSRDTDGDPFEALDLDR